MATQEYWYASGGSYYGIFKKAQTFTAESSYTLASVTLPFRTATYTSGDVIISLYAVDEEHKPTGTPLIEIGTITAEELPPAGDWVVFSGLSYSIVEGTEYAIVMEMDLYDETYADQEDIPSARMLAKTGYAGYTFEQYWYLDGATWRHTNVWSSTASDIGFINKSADSSPTKPTTPSPEDSATDVDFSDLTFSWVDGGGADTYDVYMGWQSGNLEVVSEAQDGTSYVTTIAELTAKISGWPTSNQVYWRIDATNAYGTTTGDEWSFASAPQVHMARLGAGGSFILCCTNRGLYLSTDFGSNWTQSLPDADDTAEWSKGICSGTGTYMIVVRESDGAVYRSANGGSSWGAITPAGGDTFSVGAMAMSESGQYAVIVGTNSTNPIDSCYISTDYGATWTAYNPAPTAQTWTDCDISDDGLVVGVSKTDAFYVSFDRGTSWVRQFPPGTHEIWDCIAISGDGKVGIITNTGDSDEFFKNSGFHNESTVDNTPLTSYARSLIDDATSSDARDTLELGTEDSPEFTGLTLSGLTASRLAATNGSSVLASADLSSWLSGTANELDIDDDGDGTATVALADIVDLGASV